MKSKIKVLVTGATGNQGGAVVNELLKLANVEIYALTRNPNSAPARNLAKRNIKIIQGDLSKLETLNSIEEKFQFLFFVTDFWAGKEREILFGKNIIESMKNKCDFFIFSSTPSSREEGVFSFSDSKYKIEQMLKASGMCYGILRPGLFMELFKNRKFAPPIILGMMMKNISSHKKLPFVSLEDIGKMVSLIVQNPSQYAYADMNLISEYISLGEIVQLYRKIKGRRPIYFALPDFIFKRVVGKELYDLWKWLDTKEGQYDSKDFIKQQKFLVNFSGFITKNRLLI